MAGLINSISFTMSTTSWQSISLAVLFDNVDDVTATEKFHEIFLGKVLERPQSCIWGSVGGFRA